MTARPPEVLPATLSDTSPAELPKPAELIDRALSRLAGVCAIWGVPGLEREAVVKPSARLTRALGRADLFSPLIRLHPALVSSHTHVLDEVLCHELAHLAAVRLHGPEIRPHGKEWQRLMELAGRSTRATMRVPDWPGRTERRGRVWRHVCVRCKATRLAGRPMRAWRCARCRDAGRPGSLKIERVK